MAMLPRKCAVNGCPVTSKDAAMYDFPKSARLFEAWTEFCDRGKYWKPTKNAQLCSHHFTPSDIQASTVRPSGIRGRTLRMNACPSVKVAPKTRLICCVVAGCSNNAKVTGDDVSYYPFPTNAEARREWLEFCGKNANWDPGRSMCVCSAHFQSDEMEISFIRNKKVRKLKDGAYPKLKRPTKQSPEKKKIEEQQEIKIEAPESDEIETSPSAKTLETHRTLSYTQSMSVSKTVNLIRRSFKSPFETKTRSQGENTSTPNQCEFTFTPKASPALDTSAIETSFDDASDSRINIAEQTYETPDINKDKGRSEDTEPSKSLKQTKLPFSLERKRQSAKNKHEEATENPSINSRRTLDSLGSNDTMKEKAILRSDKKYISKSVERTYPDIRRSFKRQSVTNARQQQAVSPDNKSSSQRLSFNRYKSVSMGANIERHPKFQKKFYSPADRALSRSMHTPSENLNDERHRSTEASKDIHKLRSDNFKQIDEIHTGDSSTKANSNADDKKSSRISEKPDSDSRKYKDAYDSGNSKDIETRKMSRRSLIDAKASEENLEMRGRKREKSFHTSRKSRTSSKSALPLRRKSIEKLSTTLVRMPSRDRSPRENYQALRRSYSVPRRRKIIYSSDSLASKGASNKIKRQTINDNRQDANEKDSEYLKHGDNRISLSNTFVSGKEGSSSQVNNHAEIPVNMLTFIDDEQISGEIYLTTTKDRQTYTDMEKNEDDQLKKQSEKSMLHSTQETVSKVIEVSLHNKKIKKKIKVTLNRKHDATSTEKENFDKSDSQRKPDEITEKREMNEVASNAEVNESLFGEDVENETVNLDSTLDSCDLSQNIQEFVNGTELPREAIIELGLGKREANTVSSEISLPASEPTRTHTTNDNRYTRETSSDFQESSNNIHSKENVENTAAYSKSLCEKNEKSLSKSTNNEIGEIRKETEMKTNDNSQSKRKFKKPNEIQTDSKIHVKFNPGRRRRKKASDAANLGKTEHEKSASEVRRRLSAKYVGRNEELLKSMSSKRTRSNLKKGFSPKSWTAECQKALDKNNENQNDDKREKSPNLMAEKHSTKVIEVTFPFKGDKMRKKVKVTLSSSHKESRDSKQTENYDEVSFTESRNDPSNEFKIRRNDGRKRTVGDGYLSEYSENSSKRLKVSIADKKKTVGVYHTSSPKKRNQPKLTKISSSTPSVEGSGKNSSALKDFTSDPKTMPTDLPSLSSEQNENKRRASESYDTRSPNKSSNSSYSLPEWQMCEVTRCRNNSLKAISGVIFHPLPLNHEKRNQWMEFCKPGDDWKPQEFSRVCSRHFKPEDYVHVKLHNTVKKVLKLEAIPSVYPDGTQPGSNASLNEQEDHSTLLDKSLIKDELGTEEDTNEKQETIAKEPDLNEAKDLPESCNEQIGEDSDIGSEVSHISGASYMEKSDNFSASSPSSEASNYSSSGSSKLRKKVDEQKALISTLYAAQNELKRKIRKQSDDLKNLQKMNAISEDANKDLEKKLDEVKRSLKDKGSDQFSLNKQAFRAKVVESPIGKALTENQIDLLLQVKKKVHWTNAELLNAFSLRCLSKEDYVYEHLKSTYPLPEISALQRYAQKVRLSGGLLVDVLEILSTMGKMLSEKDRATVLIYDSVSVQSTMEYDPESDEIIGPYKEVHIIMARGLFSDWKQPIFVDYDKHLTVSMMKKVLSKLHDIKFNVVAFVCDISQPKLNLLLGLGVSGKTTYFSHPRSEKKVCCFFDPPKLLEMTRKALVTKGFTYTDGTEMTKEPLSKLRNSGPYIFPDGTLFAPENMLDCIDAEMESLSSAIELFSVTISSLLRKAQDNESLMLANFIETVNKWFEIMSSLYLSGNEQLIVYYKDTDDQNAILDRAYDIIKSLRCIETNRINIFQEAILISIRSLQVLSKEMLELYDEDTIFANKLSQNALDILIDNVNISCDGVLTPMNIADKMRALIFGTSEEVVKSESTLLLAEERFLSLMAFEEAGINAIVREKTLDDVFFLKSKSMDWAGVVREIEDDGKLDILVDFLVKKHRKQFCSNVDKVPPKYSMRGNIHGVATTAINYASYSTQMKSMCTTMETFFKGINTEGTLSHKTKVLDNLLNQAKGKMHVHKEIMKSFFLQRILIRLIYLVLDTNEESASCSESDSF